MFHKVNALNDFPASLWILYRHHATHHTIHKTYCFCGWSIIDMKSYYNLMDFYDAIVIIAFTITTPKIDNYHSINPYSSIHLFERFFLWKKVVIRRSEIKTVCCYNGSVLCCFFFSVDNILCFHQYRAQFISSILLSLRNCF